MHQHEIEFIRHNISTIVGSGTQADNKAQALLGFTGIFVNLSFGVFLTAGGNAKMPGLLFITMIIFYLGSIIFSIIALWSRGVFGSNARGLDYFGHIANYPNAAELLKDVNAHFNDKPRDEELVASLLQVSRITRLKHRLVNLAFVCTGLALFNFLIIAFYILT